VAYPVSKLMRKGCEVEPTANEPVQTKRWERKTKNCQLLFLSRFSPTASSLPLNPTRLNNLDGKEEEKGIERGKGKNSLELSFHIVKGTEPLCLAAAMVDRVAKVEVAVRWAFLGLMMTLGFFGLVARFSNAFGFAIAWGAPGRWEEGSKIRSFFSRSEEEEEVVVHSKLSSSPVPQTVPLLPILPTAAAPAGTSGVEVEGDELGSREGSTKFGARKWAEPVLSLKFLRPRVYFALALARWAYRNRNQDESGKGETGEGDEKRERERKGKVSESGHNSMKKWRETEAVNWI